MKKIILILIISQITFFECKKSEVVPLFDQSANQRVSEAIDKYKTQLTTPQYGWKGAYYPNGAQDGGYSFYLKFNTNGNLTMYSDVDRQFTDTAFETTYQVKNLQKPTLIFDTYSYLHELVNPDYNGGTGAIADLELTISEATETQINLIGNRNRTEMVLTALSKTEYESLTKGGLKSIFQNTIDFTNSDKFVTLIFPSGEKSDILIDQGSKIFTIFYVKNNQIATLSSAFITTTSGIQFKDALTVNGYKIQELVWDNALKLYYFNNSGKRVNLTQANRPALPFYVAIGTLFSDIVMDPAIKSQGETYKKMYADFKAKTIELSTTAPVRVIDDVYFHYFPNDGVFALVFHYTRTYPDRVDDFGGVIIYDPTLDAKGNIKFARETQTYTLLSDGSFASGMSTIVSAGVKPFTDLIESDSFSWDYDLVETKTSIMKSIEHPELAIKGTLY